MRAKAQGRSPPHPDSRGPALGPGGKAARKRWAALIKQVYEEDPLICPKCGQKMKIINFIQREQKEVIEKVLKHCGLWGEETARAPPEGQVDGFENSIEDSRD